MGPKRQPQWVTITTTCDKGDNDKDAGDFDVELVTTAKRDSKHQAWQLTDHFKKLLKATYPNHMYPVRHKLKECTMMKNYMTTGIFAKGKRPDGDSAGKVAAPFPKEKVVMLIYGGPAHHESWCKLKLTGWAINVVSVVVPVYLRWSESPISFDWMDHLDSIPKLGRFPLIVDPLVRMTWLTKALIDWGSGLNLVYVDTFEGMGLIRDQLQCSPQPFYRVVLGKQSIPLEQVTLSVTFRDVSNYRTETLTFKVVDFSGPYHVILGSCVISSSWSSPPTLTSNSRYLDPLGSSPWRPRCSGR
jgi:hypothetical protein